MDAKQSRKHARPPIRSLSIPHAHDVAMRPAITIVGNKPAMKPAWSIRSTQPASTHRKAAYENMEQSA